MYRFKRNCPLHRWKCICDRSHRKRLFKASVMYDKFLGFYHYNPAGSMYPLPLRFKGRVYLRVDGSLYDFSINKKLE